MEDNSLYLDIKTLTHIIHQRTKGRLKLYLGEFIDGEFVVTTDTIKHLEIEDSERIKEYLRSVCPF